MRRMQTDLKMHLWVSSKKPELQRRRWKERGPRHILYESLHKSSLPVSKLYTELVQGFSFRRVQRVRGRLAKYHVEFSCKETSHWQSGVDDRIIIINAIFLSPSGPMLSPPSGLNYAKSDICLVTMFSMWWHPPQETQSNLRHKQENWRLKFSW